MAIKGFVAIAETLDKQEHALSINSKILRQILLIIFKNLFPGGFVAVCFTGFYHRLERVLQ
jgi:hypothetical protein